MTKETAQWLMESLRSNNPSSEPLVSFTGSVRTRRCHDSNERMLPDPFHVSTSVSQVLDRVSRRVWGRKSVKKWGGIRYVGSIDHKEGFGETGYVVNLALAAHYPGACFHDLMQQLPAYWATSAWGGVFIQIKLMDHPMETPGWVGAWPDKHEFAFGGLITNLPLLQPIKIQPALDESYPF